MRVCKCGNEILVARYNLGYKTCLKCGDAEAAIQTAEKAKRIAPAYSKGAYQYLGDADVALKNILDAGRKDGLALSNSFVPDRVKNVMREQVHTIIHNRKVVGKYRNGDEWVLIFDPQDLQRKLDKGYWAVDLR
jgi:hypothetical protein